jgi:hypothetical protein
MKPEEEDGVPHGLMFGGIKNRAVGQIFLSSDDHLDIDDAQQKNDAVRPFSHYSAKGFDRQRCKKR